MPQSIVLHKRSHISGVIPPLSSIQEGELGMNTADSKLFIKTSFGEVRSFISADQHPYTVSPELSSIQPIRGNNTIASGVAYGAILGGTNNLLSHSSSFILGSGLSSQAPNYTYVENLDSKGTVRCKNIEFQNTAAPTTPTDTGTPGELRWDTNHLYVCIATNSWKKIDFKNI